MPIAMLVGGLPTTPGDLSPELCFRATKRDTGRRKCITIIL
jgi:hypothetical protein